MHNPSWWGDVPGPWVPPKVGELVAADLSEGDIVSQDRGYLLGYPGCALIGVGFARMRSVYPPERLTEFCREDARGRARPAQARGTRAQRGTDRVVRGDRSRRRRARRSAT